MPEATRACSEHGPCRGSVGTGQMVQSSADSTLGFAPFEGDRGPIEGAFLRLSILMVRAYQRIVSPLLGPACRFTPSCSSYAVQALHRHSLLRAYGLILRRVTRCHPWGGHGYDPVPERAGPEGAGGEGAHGDALCSQSGGVVVASPSITGARCARSDGSESLTESVGSPQV